MIEINYNEIVTPELMEGAILNKEHPGFLEDYKTLHWLLRIHAPKSVLEVGTNIGNGVNVIKAALPDADVYSLDLPAKGKDRVGSACRFPYTQLRGDSLTFDYSAHPCEAAWIDGCHTAEFVSHETKAMLKNKTKLIIFHDSDIPEVMAGIIQGISESESAGYEFYLVTGTRLAYLLKAKNEVTIKSESFESFIEGGIVSGPINEAWSDPPEQIIPLEKINKMLKKTRKKK